MRAPVSLAVLVLAALAGAAPAPSSAQTSVAETRLRDQLKQTMTQLRALQDENAGLKTQLAAAQAQAAEAAAKPPAPTGPSPEQIRLEGSLKSSEARQADLERRSEQMDQALAQWRQGYEQAAAAYRTRDADAKRLEGQLAQSASENRTCTADNAALAAIGQELIARYKDKSLGDWMKDREPLTQLGSVKFEELAQQYHVKVTEATLPAPAAAPAP